MDDRYVMEMADMLGSQSYKVEALINVLVQKGTITKEEFNAELEHVMNEAEAERSTDEYVIEEMKEKIMLK
ncbi:MAG: hypothetical protein Q8930_04300 [Bacillota bacterium]|nr:hypothetical protein [Bacillota bacterium]